MKIHSIFGALAVAGGVMLQSCHPEPKVVDLVQDMAVQTSYDKTADFTSYATYAMPLDSIGQIYNADQSDTLITGDYASLITSAIKSNIDRRGYSRVGRRQNP